MVEEGLLLTEGETHRLLYRLGEEEVLIFTTGLRQFLRHVRDRIHDIPPVLQHTEIGDVPSIRQDQRQKETHLVILRPPVGQFTPVQKVWN
jgi:hypothetical protein